jgi:hypothetical protein
MDGKHPWSGYVGRLRARIESSPYYDPAALPRIDQFYARLETEMQLNPESTLFPKGPALGRDVQLTEQLILIDVHYGGDRSLKEIEYYNSWKEEFGRSRATVYRVLTAFSSKFDHDH